ncbi:hypothetical protein AbraIFM66950_002559 [Aspergillus brasiliensis]|nr:hypothetical protein AbraIFM66950_002559 [Aspergillus brasiliensis]
MFNPLHSLMCLLAFWAEPLLIRIEDYFERTGRWKVAQRLREKQGTWRMINFTETNEAVISLIETNMRRHELLQREAYLKERCQRRERKELSKDDEGQLEAWHEELNELNVDIWRTEREGYIYSLKVPSSPWRRALLTRLVHPEWYLEDAVAGTVDVASGREARIGLIPWVTARVSADVVLGLEDSSFPLKVIDWLKRVLIEML